jgi:hypothetical protein
MWVYYDDYVPIGAKYKNGGFTLKLPDVVDDQYLYNTFNEISEDFLTVTNRDVKITYCDIYACGDNNIPCRMGEFYHGTNTGWTSSLFYVDGDASITGSGILTDEYYDAYTVKHSIYLKKGWNIIYQKEDSTAKEAEITTQVPPGAKWYFKER